MGKSEIKSVRNIVLGRQAKPLITKVTQQAKKIYNYEKLNKFPMFSLRGLGIEVN